MIQPNEVVNAIIKEQGQIIGDDLAKQVVASTGIINDSTQMTTNLSPKEIVTSLINAYGNVFGQASINVCLDVLRRFPVNEIAYMMPDNLV